jgi:type IV pilus assembly protein PilC
MAIYSFNAVSQKGEPYSGQQEAKDKFEIAKILRQEGYVLISAEIKQGDKKRKLLFSIGFLGVPLAEKLFFTRNLQVMLGAGVPLARALKILGEQAKNKKFKQILAEIAGQIIKGKNFSDALRGYPDVFSEFFVNMAKVGEETGKLEKILGDLGSQMAKEHNLRSKVKGAMVYPAIIILAMAGIGVLMMVTVVPSLAATFEELEIELPFTTQIMIGFADFLSTKWYLVILLALGSGLLLRIISKTKKGTKTISSLFLKIPVISSIIKKTNTASVARSLSILIDSGVPMVRSLEIISRTMDNFYFKNALTTAAEKVEKGKELSMSLKPEQALFSPLFISMLETGEETGETGKILNKLADFYEEEVSNLTKNLSAVIEPVLMLVIGAAVGFFAVSMIQPMYSMLGSI